MKTVHDIDLSRIYKCPEENCHSQFVYKHTFIRHLIRVHQQSPESSQSIASLQNQIPNKHKCDANFPNSDMDPGDDNVLHTSVLTSAQHAHTAMRAQHQYVQCVSAPQVHFKYPRHDHRSYYNVDSYVLPIPPQPRVLEFSPSQLVSPSNPRYFQDPPFSPHDADGHTQNYYYNQPPGQ